MVPTIDRAYRRYVLGMLTLVYTLNYLDRGLITVLLQPIKEDLSLSDTQLGFLTGIAFSLFYATFGLPIARWADRGNRATITAMAIGLWGATVMSCVLVTNFVQLVLARIAAAVGESGCLPPTYSLIGDYFPEPGERTRAMAIFWLANPIAALISFIVGGRLNELYGWRTAFFMLGLPALIVAVIVKQTIAEPRQLSGCSQVPTRPLPRLRDVLRILWRQPASRNLIFCIVLLWVQGSGLAQWEASFMMRSHSMGTTEVGVWLGLIYACSGIAGISLGGYVAGRWFAQDARAQLRLSAAMIALTVPFYASFLLLPDKRLAACALVPSLIVCNFFLAPTFALMQRLVRDEMRATALAVVMLLANLIGFGIGPQIVGIVSDWLMPALGSGSLRYAMLAVCSVALWSAFYCLRAARTVREDLKAVAAGIQTAPLLHPELHA